MTPSGAAAFYFFEATKKKNQKFKAAI